MAAPGTSTAADNRMGVPEVTVDMFLNQRIVDDQTFIFEDGRQPQLFIVQGYIVQVTKRPNAGNHESEAFVFTLRSLDTDREVIVRGFTCERWIDGGVHVEVKASTKCQSASATAARGDIYMSCVGLRRIENPWEGDNFRRRVVIQCLEEQRNLTDPSNGKPISRSERVSKVKPAMLRTVLNKSKISQLLNRNIELLVTTGDISTKTSVFQASTPFIVDEVENSEYALIKFVHFCKAAKNSSQHTQTSHTCALIGQFRDQENFDAELVIYYPGPHDLGALVKARNEQQCPGLTLERIQMIC